MRLIDADALMQEFPCTTKCKHCGQGKDGFLPCDIKDKIKAAPTIIGCGEMDHETWLPSNTSKFAKGAGGSRGAIRGSKNYAKTFHGIAAAMADQWG